MYFCPYLVIIATIVIICCMYKRKDNLKQMEKRVQMNLDSSKDTEMSDRKREKVAETPKQKDMEMSEV